MIIFASIDGPPVSLFELGIRTQEEPFIEEASQFEEAGHVEVVRSLAATIPVSAAVICIATMTLQLIRMKVSKGHSKITA